MRRDVELPTLHLPQQRRIFCIICRRFAASTTVTQQYKDRVRLASVVKNTLLQPGIQLPRLVGNLYCVHTLVYSIFHRFVLRMERGAVRQDLALHANRVTGLQGGSMSIPNVLIGESSRP